MTVTQMMEAARAAQSKWKEVNVKQRLAYIRKLRIETISMVDEWIDLFAEETKKTPMDTLTSDIALFATACKFYEKHAIKMLRPQRRRTPIQYFGQKAYLNYEPLGVVGVISPWNFPLQLSMIPVITALIAGNAVILKPSEHTPRINQKIEELIARCGLPENLLQILHGAGEAGEQLIDARPDKVFFTGGGFVGQKVYERAARQLIPCDLELGGNDAMIVCEDANLERAARAAVWGSFMHSGQVCIGVERIYVHQAVYEPFLERMKTLTGQLRQGVTTDDDLGGMTTVAGHTKACNALAVAVQQGAKIVQGGVESEQTRPFFPPTIITETTEDMQIVREESFAPLVCVMPVENEWEAVRRSNASRYGLNSYVFTRDLDKGRQLADALEVGNCYVNDVIINIGNMHLPFGGVKASGFGRYHGAEGLYAFCNQKSVMVDRGRSNSKFNWFPYSAKRFEQFKKLLRFLYGR